MDRVLRNFIVLFAFLAGVFITNFGWMIDSAVQWGGPYVGLCIMYMVLFVILIILAFFLPENPK